ncbi:MAG: apolipoprotein N-acyltransferase [Deltaproteobacteria bacterium CG_4_9_14_3_um_filter_63_12]|nr:MAG: apolipoprotein N-acyltransferase [Deltaproteobacteria bacterium CG_4_9_14_3_um_filter_63_12]
MSKRLAESPNNTEKETFSVPPKSPPSPRSMSSKEGASGFLLRFALTSVSGVLVFTSFPTYDIWPFAYFALVPLYFALEGRTKSQAFAWGAWMGTVTNVGGFHWISGLLEDFAHMSATLAMTLCIVLCFVQGLVFALWAGYVAWVSKHAPRLPIWLYAVPAMLVAEFTFPMLFPWYFGNSQYLFYPAIQIAELVGVLGITLELMLVNTALYVLLTHFLDPTRRASNPVPWRFAVGALAFVGLMLGWGQLRINQIDRLQDEAKKLRIGMVEGDIGIWEKEDPKKLDNNILIHQNLSAQVALEGVDLIVWPESSYQSPYIWGSTLKTDDSLLLELDSLFVPRFRDGILPAMRAMRVGFGRDLHHRPEVQHAFQRAASTAARAHGYKPLPSGFPSRCGEAYETHLACPFKRVPPDEVTYFLPGYEPLAADRDADRTAGTLPWSQFAVQRGFDVPLLFGGVSIRAPQGVTKTYAELLRSPKSERELFNVAFLVDREGRVLDEYKKVYLLLFGESIPFADQIPWIYDLIPEAGSFSAGETPYVMELEGVRMGAMICYEDIIPAFSRKLAMLKPQMLINVTNDAWFGKTGEPYLHLALATIRSVESRVWLVRSTNTGVSAFVDANGRLVKQTSIHDPETLVADVPIMSGEKTIYTRIGDLIAWLSMGLVLIVLVMARRGDFESEEQPKAEGEKGKVAEGEDPADED